MTEVTLDEPFAMVFRRAAQQMAEGRRTDTVGYGEKLYRDFESYFRGRRSDIVKFLAQEVERASEGSRTVREELPGMPTFSAAILRVCVIDNTTSRCHALQDNKVDRRMARDVRYTFFAGMDGGFRLIRAI